MRSIKNRKDRFSMRCMIYHQITQHIGAVATHSKEQTGNYQSSYLFVNAITKLLLGMKNIPDRKKNNGM